MINSSNFLPNYSIRACYADTDAAGVIHHARLLEFFERSRTEWLETIGAGPKTLERQNLLLVIREVTMRFHHPGRLNDCLVFTHNISELGNTQFVVEQSAYSLVNIETKPSAEQISMASATFHIVCINTHSMKSHPIPSSIVNAATLLTPDSK